MTIVAPVDGDLVDPAWASDITDAVNSLTDSLTAWTPTLTNITQGSGGTVAAYWAPLGPFIWFRFKFTMGSGSAMGSSPKFSLPFTPSSTHYAAGDWIGRTSAVDFGVAQYPGVAVNDGSGNCLCYVMLASGTYASEAAITAAVPHAWGSSDQLIASGLYIPA